MTQIRWEVIADFPASSCKVGDILVTGFAGYTYILKIDTGFDVITEKYDLNDYPHLFKRLD